MREELLLIVVNLNQLYLATYFSMDLQLYQLCYKQEIIYFLIILVLKKNQSELKIFIKV